MEMNTRRWVMLAVLACAALAAFRLPPSGRHRWLNWEQRPRRVTQATIASNLTAKIMYLDRISTILARRDSLLTLSRSAPAGSAPLVVMDARVEPGERILIDSAVRQQVEALGPSAGSLILSVVIDSSGAIPKHLNWRAERQFILPEATDGKTCITILRLGRHRTLRQDDRDGIFGPCALYAAFGPPGSGMSTWLLNRRFDVSLNAVLPTSAKPNPHLLQVRKFTRKHELVRWLDFDGYWRSLDIAACSSGHAASCARSMRKEQHGSRPAVQDALVVQDFSWNRWNSDAGLGPNTPSFLSDLLTVYGREKFARFWRADSDIDGAFKQTFGVSTGEYTMRWMLWRYGPDQRGPYIAPRSAILSLVASLGIVGACAALAHRRQMG